MDYEKKYSEALERAKEFYILCKKCGAKDTVDFLEDNFPELCESEDERIREMLIRIYKKADMGGEIFGKGITYKQVIAWLEKQKGCECIKKDWLEHIKQSWYKEGFIDGKYSSGKQGEQKQETNYPKFTFNDVLALQCCMETAKKVQEDKELYKQLQSLHNRLYDAYQLEKQGESYTKKDVDDAYVEGIAFAKNELEKQGKQEEPQVYETEDGGSDVAERGDILRLYDGKYKKLL